MSNIARVSFTMKSDLSDKLTALSKRAGVTRSALLSDLIGPAVNDLHALVVDLPPEPTEKDIRRFSGKSIEVCEQRIAELKGAADAES